MEGLAHSEIVRLLLLLGIMLIAGRLLAELFRKLRQPAVVGEIMAGVLLGPTLLSSLLPEKVGAVLSPSGPTYLAFDGIAQVAVILLLFIAGLEVELQLVWKQGRRAALTSFLGLIFPFALGFALPYSFPQTFGMEEGADRLTFALFVGTAMSITALPVIARILMDMNLFRTPTGMLIVTAAMINDLLGWLIFSVIISMIGLGGDNGPSLLTTILLTLGFTAFMLTIGTRLLNLLLPTLNRRFAWPGGLLAIALGGCFLAAAFTEYIGIHAVFGAFILGVALGDSKHMSERAKEIVHHFINNIFAPIFFVSIGLKVNFLANFDLMLVLGVLLLAFVGKVVGSSLGARLGGSSKNEALAVGFGMNARGAMEIILGIIALENGLIGERLFVALVIMALVTSMTSGPLMKRFLERVHPEEPSQPGA